MLLVFRTPLLFFSLKDSPDRHSIQRDTQMGFNIAMHQLLMHQACNSWSLQQVQQRRPNHGLGGGWHKASGGGGDVALFHFNKNGLKPAEVEPILVPPVEHVQLFEVRHSSHKKWHTGAQAYFKIDLSTHHNVVSLS